MLALLDIGEAGRDAFEAGVEGLVRLNERYLEGNPGTPPLMRAGVRYRREGPHRERWKRIPSVRADGHGDCEDLAAWRAAELRRAGEREARVVVMRTGPKTWHAMVSRASGKLEDPSRALGMGRSELSGNGGPMRLRWSLKRAPDGWTGIVELPGLPGMKAAGKGQTRADALRKASALAQAALSNPAVQAIVPPQAQAALRAVSIVAKHPAAQKAWKLLKAPGLQKLAKSLATSAASSAVKKLKFW